MTTEDARTSEASHSMTRELPKTAVRARRKTRWVRPVVWTTIGAGAVAGIVYASLPKPSVVDVAVVAEGPLAVTIDEAGRTRVRDKYVVAAPFAGDVQRVALRPGDRVHVGTELARIAPLAPPLLDPRSRSEAEARVESAAALERQARATLARAELAAESAQADARTATALAGEGALDGASARHAELEARLREEELASARFGVQVAAHQVELARATLAPKATEEALVVRSPIEGVVLRVLHESAGPVQGATPLVEIGDLGALEITTEVLTADAVRIPMRAPVSIRRWGGTADLSAHVLRVEPSAFTKLSALGVEEQRVIVVIDLDDPSALDGRLGDGFRVDTSIEVWSAPSVLTTPMSAIFREGNAFAVYRVEGDRAKLTRVDLGQRSGSEVQLLGGLEAGMRVIEHPGPQIVDGARVRAR